jgi:CDP-diglyceride synthetase
MVGGIYAIVFISYWILLAVITARVASEHGESFPKWIFYGLSSFFFAPIYLGFRIKLTKQEGNMLFFLVICSIVLLGVGAYLENVADLM